MGDKKTGSLIIEEQKHLQEFSDASLMHYSKILNAGQIGRLLGKSRNLEVISYDKFCSFASDIGIYNQAIVSQVFIPQLEETGVIQAFKENGKIHKIEENISSEEEILKIVGEIWENCDPSDEERMSIDLINICSEIPRLESELTDEISHLGFKSPDLGIELASKFAILQKHDIAGVNEPVFHTPYYAREDTQKIIHTIKGLDSQEKRDVEELLKMIGKNQSTPISSIKNISPDLIDTMQQMGILDCTRVETISGNSERFLFTPSMWNPLTNTSHKDEQEHVRALLSCVKFGQYSPSEFEGQKFRIKMPDKYINALIQKGKVGPSSPIGTDYIVLEKEGIIKLEKSSKQGQYEMHLIKEDIAKAALRVITQGMNTSLDESIEEENRILSEQNDFDNTAQNRFKIAQTKRKPTGYSDLAMKKLLEQIRGGAF